MSQGGVASMRISLDSTMLFGSPRMYTNSGMAAGSLLQVLAFPAKPSTRYSQLPTAECATMIIMLLMVVLMIVKMAMVMMMVIMMVAAECYQQKVVV